MPAPIAFHPLFMERPWGGRAIEKELQIALPVDVPIGELWAIVDRPEAQSIVSQGPFQGTTLHELWQDHRISIFGEKYEHHPSSCFPLLCKILDAAQTLSLQVHPSNESALTFQGEPKTEFWYFLKTEPGACCYAGLKKGVSREIFFDAVQEGDVEKTLHLLTPSPGDSLFIPSGSLHALGSGNLVIEIQQNSDTTYRVFDWNRCDATGAKRQLHLEEAMASIHFDGAQLPLQKNNATISCDHFHSEKWNLTQAHAVRTTDGFKLFACLTGSVQCREDFYSPGDFFLLPAASEKTTLIPHAEQTSLLCIDLPQ